MVSRWDHGFQGEIVLTNRSHEPQGGWSLRLRPAWKLVEIWNGCCRKAEDGGLVIEAGERARVLPPGTGACIGFIASGTPSQPEPLLCRGRRVPGGTLSRRRPVVRREGAVPTAKTSAA